MLGWVPKIPKKGNKFQLPETKGLIVNQESDLWYHQQICWPFFCAGGSKGVVNAWGDTEPQLRKVNISFILIQWSRIHKEHHWLFISPGVWSQDFVMGVGGAIEPGSGAYSDIWWRQSSCHCHACRTGGRLTARIWFNTFPKFSNDNQRWNNTNAKPMALTLNDKVINGAWAAQALPHGSASWGIGPHTGVVSETRYSKATCTKEEGNNTRAQPAKEDTRTNHGHSTKHRATTGTGVLQMANVMWTCASLEDWLTSKIHSQMEKHAKRGEKKWKWSREEFGTWGAWPSEGPLGASRQAAG